MSLFGIADVVGYKWAALLISLFLVHKVAWKSCDTLSSAVTASLLLVDDLESSCPCQNKRVKVKVCTEALFVDCQRFVLDHLKSTYDALGPNVMDLEVIPFGNAKMELANNSVRCQHGLGECDANAFEQCMIYTYPSPQQYLPMLECLENKLPMHHTDDAIDVGLFETCARQANLDFEPVQACHDDKELSHRLLQEACNATPTYHNHVPWVEIDGTHMDEDTEDFMEQVCAAFVAKGGSHPLCSKTPEVTESCPCSKRVKVQVCTEALCPGCHDFVLGDLLRTYGLLGPDVMDLQVVPFGNARVVNETVICQHGLGECDANTYEQCMIHSFPHPHDYLPMLVCLEETLPMGSRSTKFPVEIFEKCAQQAKLEFPSIQYCHDNETVAWEVLQEAAKATPDHQYVPWVEIGGAPMDLQTQDFLQEVCKVFEAKGGSHPACNGTRNEQRGITLF